jgi:hypothetical protein
VRSSLGQLSLPEAVQLGLDREEPVGAESNVVDIAASRLGDLVVDLPATVLERSQSSGDTALTASASGPAARLLKRSPRYERSNRQHVDDRAAVAVSLAGRHVHEANGEQASTEAPQSEIATSTAGEVASASTSACSPSHEGNHPLLPKRLTAPEAAFAANVRLRTARAPRLLPVRPTIPA